MGGPRAPPLRASPLRDEWGSRRADGGNCPRRAGQVRDRTAELKTQFVTAHGRQPTTVDVMRLAQQATLETRPQKERRSLAEMTRDWRGRAKPYVGDEPEQLAWVASLAERNDLPLLCCSDLAAPILTDAARVAQQAVSSRRATFTPHNVTAEALRILHGVRFASPYGSGRHRRTDHDAGAGGRPPTRP